jgi:hypothetical protein
MLSAMIKVKLKISCIEPISEIPPVRVASGFAPRARRDEESVSSVIRQGAGTTMGSKTAVTLRDSEVFIAEINELQ